MPGTSLAPKLGIIAGGGALPALLMSACRDSGRPYFLIGLTGFADQGTLPGPVDLWIRLGEAGRPFDAMHAAGVKEIVMVGSVRRPGWNEIKPDLKGAAIMARIASRALGDDSLLTAIVGEIEREGYKVVGVDSILSELLAPRGILGTHRPDATASADIRAGFGAARALGAADVGQAVVVRDAQILISEDAGGTDAMLARAGGLRRSQPSGVLVKVKKPQQERRVDLPTIGSATVRNAAAAGLSGIAVEAGHTLIIDRFQMIAAADAAGLFVVGLSAEDAANAIL